MKKFTDILFWSILIILGIYILYQKGYIFKNYIDISAQDAYNRLQVDTNITLLDVRTLKEIKSDGKIENSILIPLQLLEQNIDKLNKYKNRKIFVYCRSGNRSITASRILGNHGYHPYNIKGGINSWRENRLPIK